MNENKPNHEPAVNEEGLSESNAAKRLRMTGEGIGEEQDYSDIPKDFKSKLINFWYHHKAKVIISVFFAFAIGICISQMVSQSNPDVCILYSGPDYITSVDNQNFCSAVTQIMTKDFNDDGEKKVRLTDIIFHTRDQLNAAQKEAAERGEDFKIDGVANQNNSEKFNYEVFSDNAVICILSWDQYKQVEVCDGFIPLTEIFGDREIKGAVDECGIRFSETNFYEFFESARIFPEDAVLAIRKLTSLSAITGKSKAEKVHAYHVEIFKNMADFQFPKGYVSTGE